MARPELGTKRVCPTTGRKFYDLDRDPIVSPYTGEALPRGLLEPQAPARASRARAVVEDDEDVELVPAGTPETVSLEDVGAAEEEGAGVAEEETVLAAGDGASDDTFLEEEEEEGGDVSDLIDGDIEDDEEG